MTTENSALMEALEPTWANRELANVIRNLMHQGGWGLDADAHDWRSEHPLLQVIAALSRLASIPAEREADGEVVVARIAAIIRNWRAGNAGEDDPEDTARLILAADDNDALYVRRLPARRDVSKYDDMNTHEKAVAMADDCAGDPWELLGYFRSKLEQAEQERDAWKGRAMSSRLSAPAQPVSEQGEGREGPAPIPNTRLQCFGCKNLHTEDWSEPSGDGETFDNGTTARCKAVPTEHGGEVIRSYWSRTDEAPKWCPFLPAAPQTDGGKA